MAQSHKENRVEVEKSWNGRGASFEWNWKSVKVWKEGQRCKSKGTEEALAFVVCHVSRLCLWNWTTAS